jgi:hypothetical protein
MASPNTISIARERGEQLRTLARHHNVAINELIERWIVADLAATGLPDGIPGLEVLLLIDDVTGEAFIHLSANLLPILHLSLAEARHLADALVTVADTSGGKMLTTAEGSGVSTFRVGRAVALEVISMAGRKGSRTLTVGIARDLARQLHRVADQAEK